MHASKIILLAIVSIALQGCSETTPSNEIDSGVDAGINPNTNGTDAGMPNCQITDPVSGMCLLEGLGAQAQCRTGAFAEGHHWIREAGSTPVIYVQDSATGDGSGPDRPTSNPSRLIDNTATGAIIVLSKGSHDLALPEVDDLTIIGACPDETTVAITTRGPISRPRGSVYACGGSSSLTSHRTKPARRLLPTVLSGLKFTRRSLLSPSGSPSQ